MSQAYANVIGRMYAVDNVGNLCVYYARATDEKEVLFVARSGPLDFGLMCVTNTFHCSLVWPDPAWSDTREQKETKFGSGG